MKTKHEPIRIGDKFLVKSETWEVIETRPGGHVSLFNSAKTRFMETYTNQMRDWERTGHLKPPRTGSQDRTTQPEMTGSRAQTWR